MNRIYFILILNFGCIFLCTSANFVEREQPWNADWIAYSQDNGLEYGVYYFRKEFELSKNSDSFIVHISADNRYKFYVNGKLVSLGPARGDTFYWNYETVDLSPYLKTGDNVVSALVWNEGEYRPEAQISVRTAFILQGNSDVEEIINTNSTWKCTKDESHQPIPGYFFAASKGEMIQMEKRVRGNWKAIGFDDANWEKANKITTGKLKGNSDGLAWQLVPSSIPPMEMVYQRINSLRKSEGIEIKSKFPLEKTSLVIPENKEVILLLDQTYETNAYFTLEVSGGKGAGVSIDYAESLYEKGSEGKRKGNRNEIKDKEFIGRIDSLILDGSKHQNFTSLNYRTYRYIQIKIKTKKEPLTINDVYGTFTGYPFTRKAEIYTSNEEIKQIYDIGWRTARLNAWETYMDCPYYEQLQYIGDTRIQAMISYYNSGDDRLARNALNLIDQSRLPEGVTMSRYPTKSTQIISPFSLWYIGMLHDYWWYRDDSDFVEEKLMGTRAILNFFHKYQDNEGSIKNLPYWRFVDWAGNMGWGPESSDGSAAIYDLQLLWAYQWAEEMERELGLGSFATIYSERATQLKATIEKKYWSVEKGLFADTVEKSGFSQHVNSLAILTGLIDENKLRSFANKVQNDKSLTQCTIYFQYYLNQALVKAGLGNNYLSWLDIWRENIALGLTTWAEDSNIETVRSDCHAWGASPNIEFFRIILGIDSDSSGFNKVKIEPHLGELNNISGKMPHPNGEIEVNYLLENKIWSIEINLPKNTTGDFVWRGNKKSLNSGKNIFKIKDKEK